MRILMITPPLPTATEPNTMPPLTRQIRSLQSLGIQIDVLEIRGVPKFKYLQVWPKFFRHAAPVDLIHAHYGYCGWLARSQFRKPVVVSFMGDDLLGTPDATGQLSPLSKVVVQLDRWLARTVAAVIVKSAEMADMVKPVQAHVVPNGVDLGLFQPMSQQQARARLGWPEGKHYVLFPGDPDTPRKGFPLAQSVISHIARQSERPVQLVPLRKVAPEQVPIYMNACDVMLMTSLLEGSPNVVKEAMACNLPVVSVPVGDVGELLAGTPGYVVCPRDPASLAEALIKLLAFDRAWVEGRTAIRRKTLDLESVARRLLTIYSEVLAYR